MLENSELPLCILSEENFIISYVRNYTRKKQQIFERAVERYGLPKREPPIIYCESTEAESKKDFSHKIGICKKEIKETKHWRVIYQMKGYHLWVAFHEKMF